MEKGTNKKLMDRGYGCIKLDEGEDLYFHSTSLEGVECNSPGDGQEVEFEKGQGQGGRPAAVKVKLAEAQADAQADAQVDDSGGDKEGDDNGDKGAL